MASAQWGIGKWGIARWGIAVAEGGGKIWLRTRQVQRVKQSWNFQPKYAIKTEKTWSFILIPRITKSLTLQFQPSPDPKTVITSLSDAKSPVLEVIKTMIYELTKPFGKWSNWEACITDMMGAPNNYPKETAEKVCGKLKNRLEGKEVFKILKTPSGRRVIAQYVHVEGLDKEGDIIPLARMKEALEELKTVDPRYHNVMWRHGNYQIGHPLWTFTDADGNAHKTEVDEYGLWGVTEIRNDGYSKADEVWQHLLAGVSMGASIGVNAVGKPVTLTREIIKDRSLNPSWEGRRYWDVPLHFIEPWSLTENPANQYVTAATVLSKELCEPCIEARADWYLEKGVETDRTKALDHARTWYLKMMELEKATVHPSQDQPFTETRDMQEKPLSFGHIDIDRGEDADEKFSLTREELKHIGEDAMRKFWRKKDNEH